MSIPLELWKLTGVHVLFWAPKGKPGLERDWRYLAIEGHAGKQLAQAAEQMGKDLGDGWTAHYTDTNNLDSPLLPTKVEQGIASQRQCQNKHIRTGEPSASSNEQPSENK